MSDKEVKVTKTKRKINLQYDANGQEVDFHEESRNERRRRMMEELDGQLKDSPQVFGENININNIFKR